MNLLITNVAFVLLTVWNSILLGSHATALFSGKSVLLADVNMYIFMKIKFKFMSVNYLSIIKICFLQFEYQSDLENYP